ncbi:MAG TPA: hypothetical protein VMT59_03015 [Gaiellaceae bacterium]|nr:hypothetical protein [Gaiellaceae bacterium]
MPARPARGLRLASLACVLAVGLCGAAAAAGPIPSPIGVGARYHPAAGTVPVSGLRCSSAEVPRFGVHLELFAGRRVVIVPAGIGIAPPQLRQGAYVLGGRCSYALRTREPTGVVEIERGASLTLGQLFEVWGQPLSKNRLVGFVSHAPILAFVGGRRFTGDPRAIPLRPHDEIVLELGGYVPPHASFLFRKGL